MTAVNIDGVHRVADQAQGRPLVPRRPDPSRDPVEQEGLRRRRDRSRPHGPTRGPELGPAVPAGNPDDVVADLAKRANFDTFHYTNAAVQHGDLNSSPKPWLGLEDYVLNSAKTHGFRACVFTGPVMRPEDEEDTIGPGVIAPREFLKLVVMESADQGKLHATAYLLSQGDMIRDLLEKRSKHRGVGGIRAGRVPARSRSRSPTSRTDRLRLLGATRRSIRWPRRSGGQEAVDAGEPLFCRSSPWSRSCSDPSASREPRGPPISSIKPVDDEPIWHRQPLRSPPTPSWPRADQLESLARLLRQRVDRLGGFGVEQSRGRACRRRRARDPVAGGRAGARASTCRRTARSGRASPTPGRRCPRPRRDRPRSGGCGRPSPSTTCSADPRGTCRSRAAGPRHPGRRRHSAFVVGTYPGSSSQRKSASHGPRMFWCSCWNARACRNSWRTVPSQPGGLLDLYPPRFRLRWPGPPPIGPPGASRRVRAVGADERPVAAHVEADPDLGLADGVGLVQRRYSPVCSDRVRSRA